MNDTTQWLGDCWAAALADVIASLAGERPAVNVARDPNGPSADAFWWEHELTGSASGAMWTGAGKADWAGIGKWTLGRAGIDAAEETDARNTWMEVAGQSAAALAGKLGTHLRGRMEAGEGRESAPPAQGAGTVQFRVDLSVKDAAWGAWVVFSPALVQAFEPRREAADVALTPLATAEPAIIEGREPAQDESGRQVPSKALDLLLDVELPVSVSFGRAELPLKDVLKLTTGAIVELNRTITDPVEVIVNNCVIARGEVVVVEGNYGVRIREIVSREYRMRSLR